MRAQELMTENPECLLEDDTIEKAAQMMKSFDVGVIPVVDDMGNRRLRGVITDRDIATRHVAEGHNGSCRVGNEMTKDNLYTVNIDDDEHTVMEKMKAGQVRRLPVMEDDRIIGIIAQADLAVKTPSEDAEEVEETVSKISEPARPDR